ncbi:GIY-YIG nuclease family protein [Mucilaginibacter terrigena]|uniref:GIY-YIG nuclease family protein n=2 Tax=Mucilaginibacter terrigena TaxID=2492395 RepID=A0A4Q5LHS3_9SPHI|nr:GIY-YIG nuclease family protein [Mucilaginibacter terrigena]RYU85416.1 GIY-YIG nuclease family protein [Mucilaginibacter terrigena]RYU85417.1 GIY-YIG nuclease family protein [Mucilaginibacter terrigena]RYU85418.1 GIY-YIG nuclease family protein [Mucilaginibacter terrigena]RYU85419.1 GIY-YIG nuclease family protein [Mucilaginibacter terrigena]RYU85420.1 GIY-YIG nuclease family protein [Mucilaginibacter terrigena]
MFFTYILYSMSLDKYYVGSTSNLDERVKKHNTNHKGFTGRAPDWVIKWSETLPTKEDAGMRERQIKSWKSKKMIQQLIASSK